MLTDKRHTKAITAKSNCPNSQSKNRKRNRIEFV